MKAKFGVIICNHDKRINFEAEFPVIQKEYIQMKKWYWLIISAIFFLAQISEIKAQQTIPHISPYQSYKTGMDLLDKNRYGSAFQAFDHYLETGSDPSLRANATYYRAYAAMELFHDDTESLFREFINLYPFHNKVHLAHYQLGRYYFRNEDFRTALPWLTETDPHYLDDDQWAEWHFMTGYCWLKREQFDEALEFFDNIKDYDNPFREDANYFYGYISMRKGDYQAAVSHLSRVDGTSRFDSITPVYITQSLVSLERYDEAIAYAETRLEERQPDLVHLLHRALGQAFYFEENFDATIENYELYLQEEDELSGEENYYLGYAYLEKGDYENAVKRLEKIDIPETAQGQKMAFHFGQALEEYGDELRAKNSFEFAAGLDFDQEIRKESGYNTAVLAYELDFQKEAIDRFQQFAEEFQGTELANQAQGYLGEILLATKNFQQALDIIENLPERSPEMDESYQQIAYYFALNNHQDGSYGRAKEYFEKALETDVIPEITAKSNFWLGEISYINSNYAEANSYFWAFAGHASAPQTPYYDLIHYNLAYSFFQQQEYENAAERFERFVNNAQSSNIDPEKVADARLRLADSRFGSRDFASAYDLYSEYTEDYQNKADYAYFQKATIAGLQNRFTSQLDYLTIIRDEFPGSEFLEDALFEIADVHFIRRNYNVAIGNFHYLIQEFPESPYVRPARLKIGMIHYNQQEDEQAMEILRELTENAPHSEEAREAINVLRNIYIERGEEDELFAFIETLPGIEMSASMQDSITYESALNNWYNRDWEASFQSFGRYLDEFPDGFFNLRAQHYRGESAWRTERYDEAYEHFNEVLDKKPNQFAKNAARRNSNIALNRAEYENAYKYFSMFAANASGVSEVTEARKGLIESGFYAGKHREVVNHAQYLRGHEDVSGEDKVFAAYYAGKSQLELGRTADAKESFEKVYSAGRSEKGAESLFLTARILIDQNNPDEAKDKIYKLREEFGIYDHYVARGFILLGEVFHLQGNNHQAKHTLQSVINNHTDDDIVEEAKEKLASIEERIEEQELEEESEEESNEENEEDTYQNDENDE